MYWGRFSATCALTIRRGDHLPRKWQQITPRHSVRWSSLYGHGTIFRLAADGSGYEVVHWFVWFDGAYPYGSLLEGSDGSLYGTTYEGGDDGLGTVFRFDRQGGGVEVLHSFAGAPGGGANPEAGVIEGADGLLYGTTFAGGATDRGTVFKIDRNGEGFQLLHSFSTTITNGPYGGVIQATDGALYGAAYGGGSNGVGSVYRLETSGAGFEELHSFPFSGEEGGFPYASLLEASDGLLCGTAEQGGTNWEGTLFRIAKDGSGFEVLHEFAAATGAYPDAPLVEDAGGVLYGTTYSGGGVGSYGVVFKINRDGTGYQVLHRAGARPRAGAWWTRGPFIA